MLGGDFLIGHKIIEANKIWYFEFIPTNNKKQPIGESKNYTSKTECEEAVGFLRDFIIKEHIDSAVSPFIKISETEKGWCLEYITKNETIFKSRVYTGASAKLNCKKCIESIYKRIDDYAFNRIKEDF